MGKVIRYIKQIRITSVNQLQALIFWTMLGISLISFLLMMFVGNFN